MAKKQCDVDPCPQPEPCPEPECCESLCELIDEVKELADSLDCLHERLTRAVCGGCPVDDCGDDDLSDK